MKKTDELNTNNQEAPSCETLNENQLNEPEIITIIDENGNPKDVEVLHYFTLKSNGRDYIVYTDHLENEHGNVLICTSEVIEQEDRVEFAGIESEDIIRQIAEILEECFMNNLIKES